MTQTQINEFIVEVKDIRTNNNDLWMEILKLALEVAPCSTKKILEKITENDVKISEEIKNFIKGE